MPSQKVTDILTEINSQESQIDNVTVLIQSLRDQIANGATPADLDSFLAELQQNKTKLDAALQANVS